MKRSTIELLRCPFTNCPLEIVDSNYDLKGDCVSGILRSKSSSYIIEEGFLDFINVHKGDGKVYELDRMSYVDKLIRIGWKYEEVAVMDGLRYNIIKLLDNYLDNYVNGRVLEIGAGGNILKEKYARKADDWISTDYDMRSSLDIRCDGMSLPFVEESVDVIVCIDVLEHVPNPELMMSEFSRVLSKGGVLILSTPFFFYLHEAPNDFYRFSKYGLEKRVASSGLKVIETKPTSGLLLVFGIMVTALIVHSFHRVKWLCNIFLFVNKWIQYSLISLYRFLNRSERFSQGNFVIAKK